MKRGRKRTIIYVTYVMDTLQHDVIVVPLGGRHSVQHRKKHRGTLIMIFDRHGRKTRALHYDVTPRIDTVIR